LNANLLLILEFKICELSIQLRDFSLKYINRTESLIGGKIKTWEKLDKKSLEAEKTNVTMKPEVEFTNSHRPVI
jgi:hypothetical protein